MRPSNHLPKSFSEILASGAVTVHTRAILQERMAHPAVATPSFFSEAQFETLKAVCARLIPQDGPGECVDLAGLLDTQLNEGSGKGWRYDALPPDWKMYPLGMEGVFRSANALFGAPFQWIAPEEQDEVLSAVQQGTAQSSIWREISPHRFFEELLAAVTALYYSHPVAKRLIGDLSFADARGWHYIGLEEQRDYSGL